MSELVASKPVSSARVEQEKNGLISGSWIEDFFSFDSNSWHGLADSLADQYRNASPFPHVVLENFVEPQLLDRVLEHFPSPETGEKSYNRAQEARKTQYNPDALNSPFISMFFKELNSRSFLEGLEKLTGIKGLIPDPYFTGGGFHETRRGGKLDIHADFNIHRKLNLERRVNLILFLNKNWQPEYSGCLELWDTKMKNCEVIVTPMFNKAVIFNTTLDSFHGHPDPLTCPEDISRRSIALYYYSAPEKSTSHLPKRTTVFRARPGTSDKVDLVGIWERFLNDWCPPQLMRVYYKLKNSLTS